MFFIGILILAAILFGAAILVELFVKTDKDREYKRVMDATAERHKHWS